MTTAKKKTRQEEEAITHYLQIIQFKERIKKRENSETNRLRKQNIEEPPS